MTRRVCHQRTSFAPWRISVSHLPLLVVAGAVIGTGWSTHSARAQDASLLLAPPVQKDANQLTLENSSFMYRRLPPEAEQRELQINDLVTVLVDYRSSMISEGDAEARKTASINAVLSDWLKFDGKDIFPAAQARGDPSVSGSVNSRYRAESEMELRDALMFKIAAAVVDIRPNGNLVIEARREIVINEEEWIQSLTGVISRKSIGPDRTVMSDQIHELRIEKRERGFINDSYSRGWLGRWYDKWKPF